MWGGGGAGGGAAQNASRSSRTSSRGATTSQPNQPNNPQVVERLAIPGVRRLVVVHPETRRVEGLISLSDVAAYLFL